jgi:hypothetical protein
MLEKILLGAKLGYVAFAFIVVVSVVALWMLVRRPRR